MSRSVWRLPVRRGCSATSCWAAKLNTRSSCLCTATFSPNNRSGTELLYRSPIIHASFALHHIQDRTGVDARNQVLQRLRTLNPVALVLSEPNVDHMEKDYVKRFYNCWSHFGITFEVIDALGFEQKDKDAL
jgi:hypothetical protein